MKQTTLSLILATGLATIAFSSIALADTMAPMAVIPEKNDPAHASIFNSKAEKDASLRSEISTEGGDMAFTMWMMRDHPWLYAESCIKMTTAIYQHCRHTQAMSEFASAADKNAEIRASVQADGYDVAFVDWLRTAHPDVYKEHVSDMAQISAKNPGM